jgi:tetratricopeptide (TPR) repeat protein
MSQYDPQKVEEFQMILLKNPRSAVFANLAEAYRKMGLLEEALEVTNQGVRHNPEYVSGLVAHAKVLYELKDYREVVKVLEKAHALRPENILALQLLAYAQLKLKQYPLALKAFKKLLILKPSDKKALSFIKQWEFLDNLSVGEMGESIDIADATEWVQNLPRESHAVHLIDSLMNQGDRSNALKAAQAASVQWPDSDAIEKRQDLLEQEAAELETSFDPAQMQLQYKKDFYQKWLHRIAKMN